MIASVNNPWRESSAANSIGLEMAITTPTSFFDNPSLQTQKAFWGAGGQGPSSLGPSGLGCSNCGLGSIGLTEILALGVLVYLFYHVMKGR